MISRIASHRGSSNRFVKKNTTLATPTFPNADFLVFQYTFSPSAGTDLDTLTRLDVPVSEGPIGYCSQPSLQYLFWAGDNTSSTGTEACYVDVKKLRQAYPSMTEVKLTCRANWWSARGNGNVFITMFAYSGGTMSNNGSYGFNNNGGTLLGSQVFPTAVVNVLTTSCAQTDCVGTFTYTLSTGTFTRSNCI